MKLYQLRFLLITLLFGFSANLLAGSLSKDDPNFTKYAKLWNKVDSLERKGLYRMALDEVNDIFQKAVQEESHQQVIKSVIFELKYNSFLEEDDYVLGIYRLEELIPDVPSPAKEILHSLLAEVYWGYYSANSWKFADRTSTEAFLIEDIRTWDLKRIAVQIRWHYGKSLDHTNILQTTALKDYVYLLSQGYDQIEIRPTLFDFLGYRALEFFKGTSFDLPGPADSFVLNDKKYFGNNASFLSLNPATKDSLNTTFLATKVLHAITAFNVKKGNKKPLFYNELDRLDFMFEKSVINEKEAIYIKNLERLAETHKLDVYASEAWYRIANYYNNLGDTYSYYGDRTHKDAKKKAVEICKKNIEKYPNAYGTKQCESLYSRILSKQLDAQLEEVIPADILAKFLLNYRNIDSAHYKIIPFDYDKAIKLSSSELTEKLASTTGIFTKSIDLKNPNDYNTHNIELEIPKLDFGFYYLFVGADKNFQTENSGYTYIPFRVSNLTYQHRKGKTQQEIIVSDRTTGMQLPDVTVSISYQEYNNLISKYVTKKVGVFKTDSKGKVLFDSPDSYRTLNVELKQGDDVYTPTRGIYVNRNYTRNYKQTQTHFYTDRKIYRPGQKIYFKGIVEMGSGKDHDLRTDFETTVIFYDVNGQEIEKQKVKTNKFGSFEGVFTAPQGVLTGQMRIADSHGSTYFRVEEYKRPKFNVEMLPVEGEFRVNDSVIVTGVAKAYAGNNIDGANVTYRVVRNTYFRNWFYYWGWRPNIPVKEIDHGEVITRDDGTFEIAFKAIPDLTIDAAKLPIFNYTIYADVTDINGETHSNSTTIQVGYQSLVLDNNLKSELSANEDFSLVIATRNLNGQKINAQGKLGIVRLDAPKRAFFTRKWNNPDHKNWTEDAFHDLFPNDVYEQEDNPDTWPDAELMLEARFNTANSDSIVLPNLNKWKPGTYKYQAKCMDKNGVEVVDIKYFTIYNENENKAPTNDVFWVKTLQSQAEPGETVELLLASAAKDLIVNYDVEAQGQLIESNQIKLSQNQHSLKFKISEAHRGNLTVHFTAIQHNYHFAKTVTIYVPYTNKKLDVKFSTFRNKLLPGQEEEWTLTIRDKESKAANAELLATLYDASLDALYSPNSFALNVYSSFYGKYAWKSPVGLNTAYSTNKNYYWNQQVRMPSRVFPQLNHFGWNNYYYGRSYYWSYGSGNLEADAVLEYEQVASKSIKSEKRSSEGLFTVANEVSEEVAEGKLDSALMDDQISDFSGNGMTALSEEDPQVDLSQVKARSNFNETAFFFPQLVTNNKGEIQLKFKMPESLTSWRFLGLAHTPDFKIGTISEEIITQKDLMVVPNAPRFLREGDEMVLAAKVSNISEEDLNGDIELALINPFTEEVINSSFELNNTQQKFEAKAGKSTVVSWKIKVPFDLSTVKYKIVAQAGQFSDGEENVLPILSNRQLVTESMPMPIRGNETKTFNFDKLLNAGNSKSLKHHRYTLEFTSNPAWYAVQAMPYMMEYPHECAEQLFTRFYSNTIATHIMNSNPKVKAVVDAWGKDSPDAFLSNLEKNQELKAVILEETPWVLDAQNEEKSKRNLAVLLDLDRMSGELNKALSKIEKMQGGNGGWPWFPGMKESRYITQHILTGMGHLDHLGIKSVREDRKVWKMVENAVKFMDKEIVSDYLNAKKYDDDFEKNKHLGYSQIQYLYSRSYFPDIKLDKTTKIAVEYYSEQAKKFWLEFNIYAEGMIALAAHRFEINDLASDIVKSLKDRALQHDEFGMYWKDYKQGYYWYQAPIETQALMIEMFDEVTNDQQVVDELKIWLLKQKQTTNWKTTKQTTEAVYALLLKGSDLLASDDLVEITVGDKPIKYVEAPNENDSYQVVAEAGTGYFKTNWDAAKISPSMGKIKVSKRSKGVAWGAAYWQYFEDLDKITSAETNLKLKKDLYLLSISDEGEKLTPITTESPLKVGDKVRIRIELRTDRNLEYVHMKDMRAAGFEPVNVLSRYRYQDGLGYYQSTKDVATHFFFDYIPKGTYVFEYDLRVQHAGDFSNGLASIQCMYAPEFISHSDGVRVNVAE